RPPGPPGRGTGQRRAAVARAWAGPGHLGGHAAGLAQRPARLPQGRNNVRRLTAGAPISSRTRTTSALDVGSTMRARTIARNPSSPRPSTPNGAWALVTSAQSRSADVPTPRPPAATEAGRPPAAEATPVRRSSPRPRPSAPGPPAGPPSPRRPDLGTAAHAR